MTMSKAITREHLALMQAVERARAILRHALRAGVPDRESVAIACNLLTGGLKARGNGRERRDYETRLPTH